MSNPNQDLAPTGTVVLEGDLAYCCLADVLQLVCAERRDGVIVLEEGGVELGRVVVREGSVSSYAHGEMSDDTAFFALARLRSGRFRVLAGGHLPDDDRTKRRSCRDLLLAAAAHEDEERFHAAGGTAHKFARGEYVDLSLSPRPPSPTPPDSSAEPESLDARISIAMAAYLRRDFDVARELFERCAQEAPDDPRIRLILERINARRAR